MKSETEWACAPQTVNWKHTRDLNKKIMTSECNVSVCKIAECTQSVQGKRGETKSLSDQWILDLKRPFKGFSRIFVKLWLSERSNDPSWVSMKKYAMETERRVFRDYVSKFPSPHFVQYIADGERCRAEDVWRIVQSIDPRGTKLYRNFMFLSQHIKSTRPAIQDSGDEHLDLARIQHWLKGGQDTYELLFTEYISAHTFAQATVERLNFGNNFNYISILYQLVLACYIMKQAGLSHNDLHANNYFVERANFTAVYIFNKGVHEIPIKALVKVYDFDRASTRKINPYYDLYRVIWSVRSKAKVWLGQSKNNDFDKWTLKKPLRFNEQERQLFLGDPSAAKAAILDHMTILSNLSAQIEPSGGGPKRIFDLREPRRRKPVGLGQNDQGEEVLALLQLAQGEASNSPIEDQPSPDEPAEDQLSLDQPSPDDPAEDQPSSTPQCNFPIIDTSELRADEIKKYDAFIDRWFADERLRKRYRFESGKQFKSLPGDRRWGNLTVNDYVYGELVTVQNIAKLVFRDALGFFEMGPFLRFYIIYQLYHKRRYTTKKRLLYLIGHRYAARIEAYYKYLYRDEEEPTINDLEELIIPYYDSDHFTTLYFIKEGDRKWKYYCYDSLYRDPKADIVQEIKTALRMNDLTYDDAPPHRVAFQGNSNDCGVLTYYICKSLYETGGLVKELRLAPGEIMSPFCGQTPLRLRMMLEAICYVDSLGNTGSLYRELRRLEQKTKQRKQSTPSFNLDDLVSAPSTRQDLMTKVRATNIPGMPIKLYSSGDSGDSEDAGDAGNAGDAGDFGDFGDGEGDGEGDSEGDFGDGEGDGQGDGEDDVWPLFPRHVYTPDLLQEDQEALDEGRVSERDLQKKYRFRMPQEAYEDLIKLSKKRDLPYEHTLLVQHMLHGAYDPKTLAYLRQIYL